jgi:hypothetical protein
MPKLQLDLDQETFDRLVMEATRERRPLEWQAEVFLRQALGTPSSCLSTRKDQEEGWSGDRSNRKSDGMVGNQPTLLMNIDEVVAVTGMPKWTIRSYCSQRKIPFTKIGQRVYFEPDSIKRWLQEHARPVEEVKI